METISTREYAALLHLAPNIRNAFEASDALFSEARDEVKRRIEAKKRKYEPSERGRKI
jgi:hypothetical protein